MSKLVVNYKKEEIGGNLRAVIEFKNTLGYNIKQLTEALGYADKEMIKKVLLKELPATDEMYLRAIALRDLNKIQTVKGKEAELRGRSLIITRIQKYIGVNEITKRLELPAGYIENINSGRFLIEDKIYNSLLELLSRLEKERELQAERKRQEKIFPIGEVIEDIQEEINRLELGDNIELEIDTEEYYRELNSKKRALKKLKELQEKGEKEILVNGRYYLTVN